MLIAVGTDENGQKTLILGLEAENIEHLLNDQPIEKLLADEGILDLQVAKLNILGPEDTVRFVSHYGAKIRKSVGTKSDINDPPETTRFDSDTINRKLE